jgi:hypothetical protein
MKKISTGLAAAALLALGACGGGADDAANNTADANLTATDDLTLPADENALGGDLNATDLNATDLNAADANLSADLNAAANTTNAQ